jgi:hypothetical protein
VWDMKHPIRQAEDDVILNNWCTWYVRMCKNVNSMTELYSDENRFESRVGVKALSFLVAGRK